MYCKNCGKEIDDLAVVCPNCGVATGNNQPASDDTGSIGWGLLGCCIPIVGLILFLVWRDTKPKNSKAAGIGALVSVYVSVLWYIIMVVVGVGAGVAFGV